MKARTDKQLLWKLRTKVRQEWIFSFSGMCAEINEMRYKDMINKKEHKRLEHLIFKHRPDKTHVLLQYWWKRGLKPPRIEFLNKLIKIYAKNGKANK